LSAAKAPIKLPFLPLSLAALLLALSTFTLLYTYFDKTTASDRQQGSVELSDTVNQLSEVIANENRATDNGATGNGEWIQSDQLAKLVASTDAQVDDLVGVNEGISAALSSAENREGVREVSADWALLREGLVAFNQSMNNSNRQTGQQVKPEPVDSALVEPVTTVPDATVKKTSVSIPASILASMTGLATDFEAIRQRVIESTRAQPLIDLVNNTSNTWARVSSTNNDGLPGIIEQQKANADELLQLARVGTDESLFGYYTSNQINDYVQRLGNIQLPDSTIAAPAAAAATPEIPPEIPPEILGETVQSSAPLSTAFVTEALNSLNDSIASLVDTNTRENDGSNLVAWLGLAGLATSLVLLLSSITDMKNVADILKMRPEQVTNAPREVVNRGAISLREADQLINDINAVASGNAAHKIRVPERGHARVLAESASRASGVIRNLVNVSHRVAGQLNGMVQKQDQHDRTLADYDIRRQTTIAELSDSIGERSALLGKQQALLVNSTDLIKEIDNRSATAVNGVNQVSASLATVSAQVEVSSERMQRLLQTAGSVTQATARLNQLTEQTRLQALNISLKMPEAINESATESAYSYSDQHTESDNDDVTGLFNDIHQLTGKLVQVSNETDTLIGSLQKDIETTASALKSSSAEINESAHHTLSTTLVGKELASYSDQLQELINQLSYQLEAQEGELSQTAERIVRLDRFGNEYSELSLALTQDLAGLQAMSATLEESVRGQPRGEVPLE